MLVAWQSYFDRIWNFLKFHSIRLTCLRIFSFVVLILISFSSFGGFLAFRKIKVIQDGWIQVAIVIQDGSVISRNYPTLWCHHAKRKWISYKLIYISILTSFSLLVYHFTEVKWGLRPLLKTRISFLKKKGLKDISDEFVR